jgi:hypothetical protein
MNYNRVSAKSGPWLTSSFSRTHATSSAHPPVHPLQTSCPVHADRSVSLTSHISSATLFKTGADGQRQHSSLPTGGCSRACMDDEIFQGVSFAAVKEQLQLLGHDLPDDVILAYLTEDSPPHQPRADAWLEASCSAAGCHADGHAGASGERCPLEPGEGGRPRPWSATGRPDARCSLQSHSDVDQHPCSVAGSASASDLEGTRAREAYDEEQLLLLLRLSEVGRPVTHDRPCAPPQFALC